MLAHWFVGSAGLCVLLASAAVWLDRYRHHRPGPERKLEGEALQIPVVPVRAPLVTSPGKWAFALYHPKPLLSEWERKVMFGIAKQIPRGFVLLAQVRYADFVGVDSIGSRLSEKAFYKISSKSADLVVMDRWTGKVILVIELDDDTHNRADRKVRDDFIEKLLEHVRIPMLRFTPRDHVNISDFFETRTKAE